MVQSNEETSFVPFSGAFMGQYNIALFDEDQSLVQELHEIIVNNPLYNCIVYKSLEELISAQDSLSLAIISPKLINVTKTANYLKKRGAALVLIAEGNNNSNPYGIDNVYPSISKPLQVTSVITTIELTIQNMKTKGELEVYSRYSQLLNKTLGLLHRSADSPLQETVKSILDVLYQEFQFDLLSMQIKDDQFDDTHYEQLMVNGKLLQDTNDIKCQKSTPELEQTYCLCDISRLLPDETIKQIGTPKCSIWTNDLPDFIHELSYRIPDIKIVQRCKKMEMQSVAVIRIRAEESNIGLIYIGDEKSDALNERTITFFEDLAAGIGDLIWKKQLADNIKEINKELHEAYKAGNFAMWKYYIEKDLFYFSEDYFAITDKDPQLNKATLSDFLISVQYDDRETVLKCFNNIIDKKSVSENCEFRFRNMDSSKLKYFKLSLSFTPANNSIRGVIEDITEKEVALLTVQDTKDFLNSILDGMDSAIIVVDPLKNYIIDVNKKAEELLGMTDEELYNIKGTRFLSTRYFKKNKNMVSSKNADGQDFEELLLKGKEGKLIPILRNLVTTSWKGRKHYVVIIFDITERKSLERQLNHAQKMESIGSLSAGIAHEINTPMQYVGDNLGFIKDSMEAYSTVLEKYNEIFEKSKEGTIAPELFTEVEELKEELDLEFLMEEAPLALSQAQDGVERVTNIVKAMKKFSHPGEEDMTLTDINDIISNTVIVAKNEWKYCCDLDQELQPDLPMVLCNSNDISQVILNMIVNASHAIQDVVQDSGNKGNIRIKTVGFDTHIHILIKDTGSGIDPENYDSIFNPFFTTKEVGKGTGQGLSMAYSIITEKHKGQLTFTSEIGKGTEFTIELPLNEEEE